MFVFSGICFERKYFHKTMLSIGPCPLDILQEEMDRWIKQEKLNCDLGLSISSSGNGTEAGAVFNALLISVILLIIY